MHKKILVAFTSLAILCNSLSLTAVANASPEDAIEKSALQIKELDKQIVDLNAELSKLNAEINGLNDKLKENKAEVETTEQKIKDTEKNISKIRKDIEDKEVILGKRIRGMYKSETSSNPLLLLLSSENFSDFVSKAYAVTKVISLDKKLINDLDVEKKDLDSTVDELNNKKNELNSLHESTKQSLNEIESKKSEQKSAIDKLNAEKKNASSVIEENENALISHGVSTINSSNASASDIRDAISTLKSLLPQLNSSSVKSKANEAISKGTSKLQSMEKPSVGGNNNSTNFDRGTGSAKKTLTMEATAYYDGLLTASGLKPVRNPSGISTVAVDPSVIPLGTKLYVSGYGLAIAADTGSAIKKNKIDLYMNSTAECYAFGRRSVTVQILAYPGEW